MKEKYNFPLHLEKDMKPWKLKENDTTVILSFDVLSNQFFHLQRDNPRKHSYEVLSFNHDTTGEPSPMLVY